MKTLTLIIKLILIAALLYFFAFGLDSESPYAMIHTAVSWGVGVACLILLVTITLHNRRVTSVKIRMEKYRQSSIKIDPRRIPAEYTAPATCRQWYTYGKYIDEVLSRNTHLAGMPLTMRYYVHDHSYSSAALGRGCVI